MCVYIHAYVCVYVYIYIYIYLYVCIYIYIYIHTCIMSLHGTLYMYHNILYYTILYYTILYCTILYYTILYYTILYYTILYYTILYYTMLVAEASVSEVLGFPPTSARLPPATAGPGSPLPTFTGGSLGVLGREGLVGASLTREPGCQAVWLSGCPAVWLSGCQAARQSRLTSQTPKTQEFQTSFLVTHIHVREMAG